MKKRPKRPKDYNHENVWLWKNQARLRLLIAVPAFQKDIRAARKKLGLAPEGRIPKPLDEGSLERIERAVDVWKGKSIEEIKEEVAKMPKPVEVDRELLGKCARELTDKYNLPDNFHHTLERYIKLNFEGGPPNSWEVETSTDWDNRGTMPRWVSLKIFAPLLCDRRN